MNKDSHSTNQHFTYFNESIDSIPLPDKFTFPFYYEPHPLCIMASKQLQNSIESQNEWDWDFFNEKGLEGICMGKMFGVLVVKNKIGELGFLSAFSGKLANSNHLPGFVPPVYDMLSNDGFYLDEMKVLNKLVDKIKQVESAEDFNVSKELYKQEQRDCNEELRNKKEELKQNKQERKRKRVEARKHLNAADLEAFEQDLIKESLKDKRILRDLKAQCEKRLLFSKVKLETFNAELEDLKKRRKAQSLHLQKRLFEQYQFLDIAGEKKGLFEIFKDTAQKYPPAAAGECAAPKLLQYAFMHEMKPVAMAEFWWGQSPGTEVRKHGRFYPACRGKCEPILGHMLKGVKMDANPMLEEPEFNEPIEIIYNDEAFAAIHKPHEFLSVPGITVRDSIQERMRKKFPDATGPLIVHRLDMATSGIMLIAKTEESHKRLQGQFIKRKVKKTYIAVLEGILNADKGEIDLPLRVDLDDRPRQMVCYEHGKPAKTLWEVLERGNGKTRVRFMPVTGRTHQLRVHAAHKQGLNTPIVGDDLYGDKADRLQLHAQTIEFYHPTTNEWMKLEAEPRF